MKRLKAKWCKAYQAKQCRGLVKLHYNSRCKTSDCCLRCPDGCSSPCYYSTAARHPNAFFAKVFAGKHRCSLTWSKTAVIGKGQNAVELPVVYLPGRGRLCVPVWLMLTAEGQLAVHEAYCRRSGRGR